MFHLLKEGDGQAFTELYDRYAYELMAYAVSLVKVQELAEDILQDVFTKLWDVKENLDIESNVRAYLYSVCRNRAWDVNKIVARNRDLIEELVLDYEPYSDPAIELSSEAKDFQKILAEAVTRLSPQRRRIYELCKLEKKSYVEVGKILGLSPHTVRNHVAQAVESMRESLRKQDINLGVIFVMVMSLLDQ